MSQSDAAFWRAAARVLKRGVGTDGLVAEAEEKLVTSCADSNYVAKSSESELCALLVYASAAIRRQASPLIVESSAALLRSYAMNRHSPETIGTVTFSQILKIGLLVILDLLKDNASVHYMATKQPFNAVAWMIVPLLIDQQADDIEDLLVGGSSEADEGGSVDDADATEAIRLGMAKSTFCASKYFVSGKLTQSMTRLRVVPLLAALIEWRCINAAPSPLVISENSSPTNALDTLLERIGRGVLSRLGCAVLPDAADERLLVLYRVFSSVTDSDAALVRVVQHMLRGSTRYHAGRSHVMELSPKRAKREGSPRAVDGDSTGGNIPLPLFATWWLCELCDPPLLLVAFFDAMSWDEAVCADLLLANDTRAASTLAELFTRVVKQDGGRFVAAACAVADALDEQLGREDDGTNNLGSSSNVDGLGYSESSEQSRVGKAGTSSPQGACEPRMAVPAGRQGGESDSRQGQSTPQGSDCSSDDHDHSDDASSSSRGGCHAPSTSSRLTACLDSVCVAARALPTEVGASLLVAASELRNILSHQA